eukprot:g1325.t1 g1325   contig10:1862803-1865571(+)
MSSQPSSPPKQSKEGEAQATTANVAVTATSTTDAPPPPNAQSSSSPAAAPSKSTTNDDHISQQISEDIDYHQRAAVAARRKDYHQQQSPPMVYPRIPHPHSQESATSSAVAPVAAAANHQYSHGVNRNTHQDGELQRRESYEQQQTQYDDLISTTWSRDSEGRPIPQVHSWHPSHQPRSVAVGSVGSGSVVSSYRRGPHPSYHARDTREPHHYMDRYEDYYHSAPPRPSSRQSHGSYRIEHHPSAVREDSRYPTHHHPVIHRQLSAEEAACHYDRRDDHHAPMMDEYNAPMPPTAATEQYATTTATASKSNKKKTHKGCTCKKTKCLKLYCACFSHSIACDPSVCSCERCANTQDELARDGDNGMAMSAVVTARKSILERNPRAFERGEQRRMSPSFESLPLAHDPVPYRGGARVVRPMYVGHHAPPGHYYRNHIETQHADRSIGPSRRVHEYGFRSLDRERSESPTARDERGLLGDARKESGGTAAVHTAEKAEGVDASSNAEKEPTIAKGGKIETGKDVKSDDGKAEEKETTNPANDAPVDEIKQSRTEESEQSSLGKSTLSSRDRRDDHSPSEGYYRPMAIRQMPSWEGRHYYPREVESRRSYDYYYDPYHPRSSHPHEPPQHYHGYYPPPHRQYYDEPRRQEAINSKALTKQTRICRCKKSQCLKKYCECFADSLKCTSACKCENCGNRATGQDGAAPSNTTGMNEDLRVAPAVTLEEGQTAPDLPNAVSAEDHSLPPATVNRDDESSLKTTTSHETKDKACEKKLDFLATLAMSRFNESENKRTADDMEESEAASVPGQKKYRSETYNEYDSYNQGFYGQQPSEYDYHRRHPIQPHYAPARRSIPSISASDIAIGKLPKGLTYRKVCSCCGRQRAEHGEFGFGNKCLFTTCGKCGASAESHRINGTQMGFMCTLARV